MLIQRCAHPQLQSSTFVAFISNVVLAHLPDDLEVLKPLQQQVDVEGADGQQVNLVIILLMTDSWRWFEEGHHVHCILDKLLLDRADEQPEDVLDGEEDDDEVVDEGDDGHDDRVVALPLLVLLQLLDGGEDEGDGGDEHHGQGEESNKLSKPVRGQEKNYIPIF